jgi:5-methylthioadenosine/S-adenosylhomocysteine deaminase
MSMSDSADLLLTNGLVLTMDESFSQFEPGAVAVRGDSIVAVGPADELERSWQAETTIDCQQRVILPGLVNAHTHVPMTLLRGLADDLRLDVWLLGYIMPVEREYVSPEFVRLGTSLACLELIRSGVTCFADMYYFEEEVAKATAAAGLRGVVGQTVLRFPAPDAHSFEESLALARKLILSWQGHELIVPSVAPHAPYTCTDQILQACAELAVEYDVPLQIHLAETRFEVDTCRTENKMPVIPYIKKQNLLDAKVIGAHCVHVDEGEIHTLLHYGAGVVHNPSSNMKLASGFAPVAEMRAAGLSVGIGTDGPASNNDLDMFEEMRLAGLLAKGRSGDPTAIPAREALAMATRIGAESLHMGDLIGSLEPGKRADLITVDLACLHNLPRFHRDRDAPYAQLVYAAKSTDVTDVMVNGQWLMRDCSLVNDNRDELLAEAAQLATRIDAFLVAREQSVYSKLVAIGGAMEQESFEVQAKVRISDPEQVVKVINSPGIEVLHHRHYHEFDSYFFFTDPEQGRVRFREDEYLDKDGKVTNVRSRLTLIGPTRERRFPSEVLLSRSRFIAPADRSRRFYREYFKPTREVDIEKDRRRWRILFRGTELYINLDRIESPSLGCFLEVKSRTWSQRDAEHKAEVAQALLQHLEVGEMVTQDYTDLATMENKEDRDRE